MPTVSQNIKAFARVLWDSEGTYNSSNPSIMYRTIYGGTVLPDTPDTWRGHPNRKVTKWGKTSSAAGAYQFTFGTWSGLVAQISLPDFTPISQDRAFVQLLMNIGVYKSLTAGDLNRALQKANGTWSSLPGGVHQRRTIAEITPLFQSAGGQII